MNTSSKTKLFTSSIYLMAFICLMMVLIGFIAPAPMALEFLMYTGSFVSIGFVGITLYLSGSR